MSRSVRGVLAVLSLGAASLSAVWSATAEEAAPASLVGNWTGAIAAGGAELPVVIKVKAGTEPGQLVATLDSPRQGARDIPLRDVSLTDGRVALKLPAAQASYSGRLSADGTQIEGTWTQGGQSLPLTLKRVDVVPESRRPQEPKPPYPYLEEEVSYPSGPGVTIAGTFTRPKEGGPFATILLVSGSGPQDRDSRVFGHPLYLVLADHLTRAGLAVLRVDDRGVGRSTGDLAAATTEDFAADARAGLEYLKTRKDVDARRLGLYGHSEGGLVVPMVASDAADVAFVVLVAAPGMPLERGLPRQSELVDRAEGRDEATIARNLALQKSCFAVVKEEADPTRRAERLRALLNAEPAIVALGEAAAKRAVEGQVRMMSSPWMRYILTLDPAPFLGKVRCPVLAVNGDKDLQVPPENLEAVRAALEKGGNKNVRAMVLPGLNHLLQTSQTGAIREYAALDETLAPSAADAITAWLVEQTKPSPGAKASK